MPACDLVTGSLPRSRTCARRDYVWLPHAAGEHPDGRAGTLWLVSQGSRRPGAGIEADSYGVWPEDGHYRLTKDDGGEAYHCAPRWGRCSCPAGAHGRTCKHTDALRALLTDGWL